MVYITVNIIVSLLPTRPMPRPPFSLTDQQASDIARGVAELDARIPRDPRSHRPFVRSFIGLVRAATGNLYSPTIYRRLLDAYASDRRPSMTTLAAERERAGRNAPQVAPTLDGHGVSSTAPSSISSDLERVRDIVADALEEKIARVVQTVEYVQNAQLDFYQHQLEQVEHEAKALRTKVATLGAELAAARQSADHYRTEAQNARDAAERHVRSIEQLSRSTDEMRKFALIGIDDARSEVRQWKERCTQLELLRHKDAQAMDALRNASFDQARMPAPQGPRR